MIVDLLRTLWLLSVAGALLAAVAPRLLAVRLSDSVLRFAESTGCLALLVVISVSVLSDGRLLNWFTLLFVCIAAPLGRWLAAHGWSGERAVRETTRRMAIDASRIVETRSVDVRLDAAVRWRRDAWTARFGRVAEGIMTRRYSTGLFLAVMSAAAAVTVYLRYAPVLGTARLGLPEAYGLLLQTRQALHNEPGSLLTPATAALAAALALATSLEPMHVVRLMGPAVGVATVCAAAILAHRVSRSVPVSVMVFWILGGCTFAVSAAPATGVGVWWVLDRTLPRQWTANDGTTGLLFLLVAGICLEGWRRDRRGRDRRALTTGPASPSDRRRTPRGVKVYSNRPPAGALASAAVVSLASPMLLLLMLPAGLAALVPRPLRLFTLAAGATGIALYAAQRGASDLAFSLPVAAALLAAATCALCAQCLGRVVRADLQPTVAGGLMLCSVALLPQRAGALYVEHEVSAAKTLEIASTFRRGRWLIVGAIEQLAETYGRGWFQDPASFLAENGERVQDPAFRFDMTVDDLFVFVERRPFKTFASEPADLPFSTLADPSYRQYRSLAGRASVQAQLYALCESYKRTHTNASIYYEDAQITIYRFRPQP
jgi:hypothetical protein